MKILSTLIQLLSMANCFGCRRIIFFIPVLITVCFCSYSFSQGKTILQGQIKQSNGDPLRNSAVLLFQYNPATKSYSVMDSAYTDATGNYKFDNLQQYFLLAKPDESFVNELQTYYGNTLFLQKANPVSINLGDAVIADFTTTKKTGVNAGNAAVGGVIAFEKKSLPASDITVFIADKEKNPIAATSADASGRFQFVNLPYGDYYLWIDLPGIDNTAADAINLNDLNPMKSNLHFRVEDGILNCVENNYSGIQDALDNKENVYAFNLNSIRHDVAEKSLLIAGDGSITLSPKIGEFTNLESLSIDIDLINTLPAEIGKLRKLTMLSGNLNKLATLPAEMENLKNLKILNLEKNSFNKFPDVITKLSSLEVLDFESNPISALPAAINAMSNLKELNLANCFELLSLPPQIGGLGNLETLNLSNCVKIKSLPKELNNLKNLKVLDISGIKISAKNFQKAVPKCEVRVSKK